MKVTIDSSGRLVLPKAIRRAMNMEGTGEVELEVRIVGDHLEIEPVPAEISFVRKGDFVVAIAEHKPEKPLTSEIVEQTRAQIHTERGTLSRE